MVDFAKIREENAKKAEAARAERINEPTPRDNWIRMLNDLKEIEHSDLNGWEQGFVNSVRHFLVTNPHRDLSVKQVDCLVKMWNKYFTEEPAPEDDPTPSGNPPAQYAKKGPDRGIGLGSLDPDLDNMDDDIPF